MSTSLPSPSDGTCDGPGLCPHCDARIAAGEAPYGYAGNIAQWLDAADPEMWEQGRNWYRDARSFSRWLGETYGVSLEQAAGVVAVLSPRVSWDENMRAAAAVCAQWKTGSATVATVMSEPGITVYGANVEKALRILSGGPKPASCDSGKTCLKRTRGDGPCAPIHGPKVAVFYRAILGSSVGTIDVWACRAATISPLEALHGVPMSDPRRQGIPGDRHGDIADAYREAGEPHKLNGAECQAVVWLAIRVYWNGRMNPNQQTLPF